VIGKVLTGYTSGAGTVASTDTILQAIQKLNGNVALKAALDSPTFTTKTTHDYATASKIAVFNASKELIASSTNSSELGTYVVGPGAVTTERLMVFNGTTGYLAKQSGLGVYTGYGANDPYITSPNTCGIRNGGTDCIEFGSGGSLNMLVSGQSIKPFNSSTNIDLGLTNNRFNSLWLKGSITATACDLILETAGRGLKIKEGSNARMGQSTLVGGTVTVSNTSVTANSRIFLTCAVTGGTQGILSVGTITASTSFVINSSNGADTSTVNWIIVEPS